MDAEDWTDCWTGYEAKPADGQPLADGEHTVEIRAKGDDSRPTPTRGRSTPPVRR